MDQDSLLSAWTSSYVPADPLCLFLLSSPIPSQGGVVHGPRGPTSYYYMLPMKVRVSGLKVALTTKLMQVPGAGMGGEMQGVRTPGFSPQLEGEGPCELVKWSRRSLRG